MRHFLLALPLLAAPALSVDEIDDLIEKGRSKLDLGDTAGALEFFNQADAEAGGALRARMWVLRGHFEQGAQIMDAFDEVDELAAEHEGPDLDYLYGMGSYFKAKKYMAEGVQDNTVRFAMGDAQSFLAAATKADGKKYYDAWYPLADAAWMNQDLDVAGSAIGEAVQVRKKDPGVRFLQGRVQFSLYTATKADDEEAAGKLLDASIEAYGAALDLIKQPKRHASMAAEVLKQLAIAQQWKGEAEAAQESYAASIGWEPNTHDYGAYWGSLGIDGFIATLEQAAKNYEANYGAENSGDATMLWWLGSAYHSAGKHDECEATYLKVLDKWPAYVNSWFYVGLSRYFKEDYDGAIDAWHENWKADATNLVASIQSNQELYLEIVSFVIKKCAEKGQPPAFQGKYNVKAAFLCEVRCAVDGSSWEYFNDWGLFARDGGAFLARRNSKSADRETAVQLWEASWKAYQDAWKLAPDKPHLYNDGAVLLHYYLEREYDHAFELYDKAYEMASAQLEEGGLSEEDRALVELAKRDSKDNAEKLRKKIEEGGGK